MNANVKITKIQMIAVTVSRPFSSTASLLSSRLVSFVSDDDSDSSVTSGKEREKEREKKLKTVYLVTVGFGIYTRWATNFTQGT